MASSEDVPIAVSSSTSATDDPRPPVKPHSVVSSTNPWVHEGPTGHTGCGIIAGPFLVLAAIWGWIFFWAWFNDVIWDPMMSGLGF